MQYTVKFSTSRRLFVVVDRDDRVLGSFFSTEEARTFAAQCYRNLDRGYTNLSA